MMRNCVTALIGALAWLSCAPTGSAKVPDEDRLPTTASTAGALNNSARAPWPNAAIVDAECHGLTEYCPSRAQVRADTSFSAIAIDSYLSESRGGLAQIVENDCEQGGECEWRDAEGVRHFVFGDTEADLRIVIKIVRADEFVGRPIAALGIGGARHQADVMTNVRRFLPGIVFDCDPQNVSGNVGPVECGATLNPGWVQIGFDRNGDLLRIRFDGYQFT